MNIKEVIEDYRFSIMDLNVEKINFDFNQLKDKNALKGAIVESFVHIWLSKVPEIEFFTGLPKETKNYFIEQNSPNITIINKKTNKKIHEFDGLIKYNHRPYIIEVKSGGLNGFIAKIPSYLKTVSIILETKNPHILIFYHQFYRTKKVSNKLIEPFPTAQFIDLNYRRKDLKEKLEETRSYLIRNLENKLLFNCN